MKIEIKSIELDEELAPSSHYRPRYGDTLKVRSKIVELDTLDEETCGRCAVIDDPFWGLYIYHEAEPTSIVQQALFLNINEKNKVALLTHESLVIRTYASQYVLKESEM